MTTDQSTKKNNRLLKTNCNNDLREFLAKKRFDVRLDFRTLGEEASDYGNTARTRKIFRLLRLLFELSNYRYFLRRDRSGK